LRLRCSALVVLCEEAAQQIPIDAPHATERASLAAPAQGRPSAPGTAIGTTCSTP